MINTEIEDKQGGFSDGLGLNDDFITNILVQAFANVMNSTGRILSRNWGINTTMKNRNKIGAKTNNKHIVLEYDNNFRDSNIPVYTGLFYHELAHVMYSPAPDTIMVACNNNRGIHQIWNSLEDCRIENIISKKYNVAHFLIEPFKELILKNSGNTNQSYFPVYFQLTYGRMHLATKIRNHVYNLLNEEEKKKFNLNKHLIDEYITLKNDDVTRMIEIAEEVYRLVSEYNPLEDLGNPTGGISPKKGDNIEDQDVEEIETWIQETNKQDEDPEWDEDNSDNEDNSDDWNENEESNEESNDSSNNGSKDSDEDSDSNNSSSDSNSDNEDEDDSDDKSNVNKGSGDSNSDDNEDDSDVNGGYDSDDSDEDFSMDTKGGVSSNKDCVEETETEEDVEKVEHDTRDRDNIKDKDLLNAIEEEIEKHQEEISKTKKDIQTKMDEEIEKKNLFATKSGGYDYDVTPEMRNTITKLTKKFEKFKFELRGGYQKNQMSGALDLQRAFSTQRQKSTKIFRKFKADQRNDAMTDVYFMLDLSGSMSGENIREACKGLHILTQSHIKAGNEVFSYGFADKSQSFFLKNDRTKSKSTYRVYKTMGSTNPLRVYDMVISKVNKSKKKNKIVIVLTDGGFDCDAERNIPGRNEILKKQGCSLIKINYGYNSNDELGYDLNFNIKMDEIVSGESEKRFADLAMLISKTVFKKVKKMV